MSYINLQNAYCINTTTGEEVKCLDNLYLNSAHITRMEFYDTYSDEYTIFCNDGNNVLEYTTPTRPTVHSINDLFG